MSTGWAVSASLLALSCVGCGASTILVQADDAAAVDAPAPPDAAADARRCDPSVLADAGPAPDVAPPDAPYVVDLSLQILTQCARMSEGTLRCRGANLYGTLGNGTEEPSYDRAVEVPGLMGIEQVVVNDYSVCARLRDGTVRCWGDNNYHLLGVGHDGDETCRFGGACRRRPAAVPGLSDVVHLTSASFVTCAVRRDGSVWCWGSVGFPVLSTPRPAPTPVRMEGLDDVVWLRAALLDWYVLHRDGRWETRRGLSDSPTIPRGATLAEGPRNSHVCYRLPDTSVRCFGSNPNGKIGNGASSYPERVTEPWDPGLCGVRDLATGGYHTCAVTADRRVWCWGDASYDSLGVPANDRCVGINGPSSCVTRPTRIEGLDQVDRVFAGIWGNCAIRLDRTVWCWGNVAPMREARPTLTAW
ncbi:MAG: hypothetical protein U0324_08435 [Polyangiales bacterium]